MFWSNYTTITRRNTKITLPKQLVKEMEENRVGVALWKKGNNNCVWLYSKTNGDYLGSLRKNLGIKSFKDGNTCNFKKSNLIFE